MISGGRSVIFAILDCAILSSVDGVSDGGQTVAYLWMCTAIGDQIYSWICGEGEGEIVI